MQDPRDAEDAVKSLHRTEICGMRATVKMAREKEEERAAARDRCARDQQKIFELARKNICVSGCCGRRCRSGRRGWRRRTVGGAAATAPGTTWIGTETEDPPPGPAPGITGTETTAEGGTAWMIGTGAAETTGRRTGEMTGGEEEVLIETTVIETGTRIEITEEIEIEDKNPMEKMSEEQGFC